MLSRGTNQKSEQLMQQCNYRIWQFFPKFYLGVIFLLSYRHFSFTQMLFSLKSIYTKSEKSGKCSAAALGFYFSLLDKESVFGEPGFGLLALPKWMPQVVKRDSQETCVQYVFARFCTYVCTV